VLREKNGKVVGGRKGEAETQWIQEPAGGQHFYIRNVETGHYMYAAEDGESILCGKIRPQDVPEAAWSPADRGASFANRKTGKRVVPNVKANTVSLGEASGRSVHWAADPLNCSFHPDQGGREGDRVWAYREWRCRGHFLARAVIAERAR